MSITENQIVEWRQNLSVGIKTLDFQHRELLQITNDLFTGCLYGKNIADAYFRTTAHQTVDYIRDHFVAEEYIMKEAEYPGLPEHRKQHGRFSSELLKQIRKFETGTQFVPIKFARHLRDWILNHIAIMDRKFGLYYAKKTQPGIILKAYYVSPAAELFISPR
jgi:hemerythrin